MTDIAKAIAALKTPKARATALYNLAQKKENGADVPDDLPKCGADCAWHGVGLAWKDRRFDVGFRIARVGGILDELSAIVEALTFPYFSYNGPRQELPEEIKKLPGFKEIPRSDYENQHAREVVSWAKQINEHLVTSILIPAGEHHRAAQQMIKLDQADEAVEYASKNLEPEQLADVCELAQTGFEIGIRAAVEHEMPALEERLKKSHVDSVKSGHHERMGEAPGRWGRAISIAKRYWPEGEESGAILEEGVNSLAQELFTEMIALDRKIKYFDSWAYSSRSEKRDFDDETSTKRQLMRRMSDPAPTAKALVDLVKTLPEERIEQEKERIYQACEENNSPYDGFGIANLFQEPKKAVEFAIKIIRMKHHGFEYGESAKKIPDIVGQRELLKGLSVDDVKEYIKALNCLAYSSGDYDDSRIVAKQHGLSRWLMEELENGQPRAAAGIALDLGEKEKAKNLFVKSGCYKSAIEYSDSPDEKAEFHLILARETVDDRVKYGSHWGNEKYNQEVEHMRAAAGLVSGSQPSRDYTDRITGIVTVLFENGDFTEGCLVAEELMLPAERIAKLATPEAIIEAEKRTDFAGCHHLARVQGDSETAESYRIIAESLEQKMHAKLEDFIYVKPKPQKAAAVDDDEPY